MLEVEDDVLKKDELVGLADVGFCFDVLELLEVAPVVGDGLVVVEWISLVDFLELDVPEV